MSETGQPQQQKDETVSAPETEAAAPVAAVESAGSEMDATKQDEAEAPERKDDQSFLASFNFTLFIGSAVLIMPALSFYLISLPFVSYAALHPHNTEFFTERNMKVFNKMSLPHFTAAQREAWDEKQKELVFKIRTNNYSGFFKWDLNLDGDGGRNLIYVADVENVALVPSPEAGRPVMLIRDSSHGCLALDEKLSDEENASAMRTLLGELDRRRSAKDEKNEKGEIVKKAEEKYGAYVVSADGKVKFSLLKPGQSAFAVCPSI